jgi:hypothetical protein
MSEIKIIKDCLSKEDFTKIKNILFSDYFSWYLNVGVNNPADNYTQFTHVFFNNYIQNSNLLDNLKPIINVLNPLALIRVKANLLTKTNEIIKHGFHIDQNFKCTTAIFYVNNNNGYTEFESGEKVYSEENKLVIFDTFLKHTGTTCTDKNERIIINFNYVEKIKQDD